jgi:hypothetical protein
MLHPNLRPNFLGFEDEILVLENFGAAVQKINLTLFLYIQETLTKKGL